LSGLISRRINNAATDWNSSAGQAGGRAVREARSISSGGGGGMSASRIAFRSFIVLTDG